jgi:DNA-binding MarR family transcriptional regulator
MWAYNQTMNHEALQDNLYWLFLVASFQAKKGFINIADQHGLTVVQLYALCTLEPGRPLPMKEIANVLNCDPSNVTGIIDRLFLQHFIERQELPADRRVKMVALTPQGIKLRDQLVEGIVTYRSDRLERLTPAERTQLKDLLRHILAVDTSAVS